MSELKPREIQRFTIASETPIIKLNSPGYGEWVTYADYLVALASSEAETRDKVIEKVWREADRTLPDIPAVAEFLAALLSLKTEGEKK